MTEKEINFSPLIQKFITTSVTTGETEHISVYLRALNNGDRLGIDEKEYFSPASLIKVPVLMAYLKKSELEK
jgi:beta-lactamase class A